MQKKIILFGGTFDPPHNGHMALLESAVALVQPDLVLIEPAGVPPHKAASTTPAEIRLLMCQCFLPLAKTVQLDNTEILREGKSYTFDTLCTIEQRYPDAQLYFPIGSDMLLYFKQWHRWQEVLKKATLVVQCRRGEDKTPVREMCAALQEEGATLLMVQEKIVTISSTQIRALVQKEESIAALVPPMVQDIIIKQKLYRN